MSEKFLSSANPSSFAAIIDRFFLSIDYYIIWIILILVILALIAYISKQMTFSGIIASFFLGLIVILAFGFGGLTVYLFFVLGAGILSKLNKNNEIYKEANKIQEKSGSRDFLQVFANGGISFILSILYLSSPNLLIIVMFGASVSEAVSDTFAGEVGMLMKGKTVSILNGRPMKPGLSGGVSFEGTLGSLIGAFLVSLLWYSTYFSINIKTISFVVIVTLSGFLGSLFDSILGLTIQAHYYDEEEDMIVELEEKNNKKLPLVKGIRFFNNDRVNFVSNLISILFASMFYLIIM